MKQTLMLFLSANHLHAQYMENGKIKQQQEFANTQEGRDDFSIYVTSKKYPTYLLTDLIEEDFRNEIVPHLFGGSRTALLNRKFDQFYRSTPFQQATFLQRQKSGRRDDDMLFSALTNPILITPWLNILLSHQVPLAGIYSVPQISAPLIKNHPSNYLLLISWEKYSGLRQTYFSQHRLQISRLTTVHGNTMYHEAVVDELARTYKYLKSLSLLPSGQFLDVLILCHSNDRTLLQNELPNHPDVNYDFADIEDVGRQLKIDGHMNDSDASQIFLQQLATSPPKTSYANSTHTHFYSLWLLRRALNFTSITLLAVTILWSTSSLWQSSNDSSETLILQTQAQDNLNEVQKIISSFPNTYAPAADMKAAVLVKNKLDLSNPYPSDILIPVSTILGRHYRIELDEISWKTDPSEPVEPNTQPEVPAQVINLKGHLKDFAKDYRSALNYLDSFQQNLMSAGYKVTVLSRPLDITPSGEITDKKQLSDGTLGFALKISRRPSI